MNELLIIEETDFHSAWSRMVHIMLRDGTKIVIGSQAHPKPITEMTTFVSLTGNAIKQIEKYEIHPQFPFKFVDSYANEFTYDYQKEYEKNPSKQFVYTYFERLARSKVMKGTTLAPYDQLIAMCQCLFDQVESGISSNRCQATTWMPMVDTLSPEPPCWQRLWIHHVGDNKVDVHLDWRSRDLFSAWQANLIAIVQMLNKYVIHPNGCKIVRIVEMIDSLHIYESDRTEAEAVKITQVNPLMRR